jgi:DNA-directed RNA polymerase specialized sigma24 family protein
MRFTRFPIIPYVVGIEELEDIFEDKIQPEEKLSEAFYGKLFQYIHPGDELVCVILRSNDLSYKEIAYVMGKKKEDIESMIYRIRKRVEDAYRPKNLVDSLTNNG